MEPSEWGRISQLLTQLRHELQENEDSPAFRAVVLAGVTPVQSRVGYSATNKAVSAHPSPLYNVAHHRIQGSGVDRLQDYFFRL